MPVPECKGKTLTPIAAAAYNNNLPCDGGIWTDGAETLEGTIHLGAKSDCMKQCVYKSNT